MHGLWPTSYPPWFELAQASGRLRSHYSSTWQLMSMTCNPPSPDSCHYSLRLRHRRIMIESCQKKKFQPFLLPCISPFQPSRRHLRWVPRTSLIQKKHVFLPIMKKTYQWKKFVGGQVNSCLQSHFTSQGSSSKWCSTTKISPRAFQEDYAYDRQVD